MIRLGRNEIIFFASAAAPIVLPKCKQKNLASKKQLESAEPSYWGFQCQWNRFDTDIWQAVNYILIPDRFCRKPSELTRNVAAMEWRGWIDYCSACSVTQCVCECLPWVSLFGPLGTGVQPDDSFCLALGECSRHLASSSQDIPFGSFKVLMARMSWPRVLDRYPTWSQVELSWLNFKFSWTLGNSEILITYWCWRLGYKTQHNLVLEFWPSLWAWSVGVKYWNFTIFKCFLRLPGALKTEVKVIIGFLRNFCIWEAQKPKIAFFWFAAFFSQCPISYSLYQPCFK